MKQNETPRVVPTSPKREALAHEIERQLREIDKVLERSRRLDETVVPRLRRRALR